MSIPMNSEGHVYVWLVARSLHSVGSSLVPLASVCSQVGQSSLNFHLLSAQEPNSSPPPLSW